MIAHPLGAAVCGLIGLVSLFGAACVLDAALRSSAPSRPALPRGAPREGDSEPAPSGCWLWTGTRRAGYGLFFVGSRSEHGGTRGSQRMVSAHRWGYEHLVGPIPDGLHLDHLCRTPACVNPDHLEPVTRQENMRRAVRRQKITTRCVHGHLYDEANTLLDGNGWKRCRACARARRELTKSGAR